MEEKRTILVVDDEPEVSSVLESALDSREYQIRSAHKWTEAIAAIHETPPDIVLLDLYLPTVQGEALLEFMKDMSLDFPVVIVSSEIDPGKMQQLGQLGASGFVRKPFEEDDLVVVVEQVLAMWSQDLANRVPTDSPSAAEQINRPAEATPPETILAVSPGAGIGQLERAQPQFAAESERRRGERRPRNRRRRPGRHRRWALTFLIGLVVCIVGTWLMFEAQGLLSSGFFGIDIDTGP